jgi:hypothetical protein
MSIDAAPRCTASVIGCSGYFRISAESWPEKTMG